MYKFIIVKRKQKISWGVEHSK